MQRICRSIFVANTKEVACVKIAGITLRVSIVINVIMVFTDQLGNCLMIQTCVNVRFIIQSSKIRNYFLIPLKILHFQLAIVIISIRLEIVQKVLVSVNAKKHSLHQIVTDVVRDIMDIPIVNLANASWMEPEDDSARILVDNVLANRILVENSVINALTVSIISHNANVYTFP